MHSMFLKLRSRLTFANVVASLALFIALGGSSYAALTVTGRNVPDGSLSGRDIRNQSVTGRDVSGLTAADFRSGVLAALQGPAGLPGLAGAKGEPGAPGAPGPAGQTGAAGPAGANGADGADGADGVDGEDGTDGARGATGAQGATGPQGPAGPSAGSGAQADPEPDIAVTDPVDPAARQAFVTTTITLGFPGRVHAGGSADLQKDGTSSATSAHLTCDIQIATFGLENWADVGEDLREDIGTANHHRQITIAASVTKPAGRYSLRLRCWGNNGTFERGSLTAWGTQDTP